MRPNDTRLLLMMVLSLALTPNALASTWYVNGTNGSDSNNCMSSQTPCKTIGHAISLAASGDSIMVAAATYKQNLTIGGGIFNNGGTLAINNSTLSGNSASATCPPRGFCHSDAGGIFNNNGTLAISGSTLSSNSANEAGGIDNRGMLTTSSDTSHRKKS